MRIKQCRQIYSHLFDNNKMRECDRDPKRKRHPQGQFELQISHILPKANDIVKTSEQIIKSLYPYPLVASTPSKYFAHHIPTISYDSVNKQIKNKFAPVRSSLLQHFETKYIIYDSFNMYNSHGSLSMNIFSIDRLKSLSKNDFMLTVEKTSPFISSDCKLQFDSRFQCGNLAAASYVDGLYCLLLHNDVNTSGYTNWYYFSAICKEETCRAKMAIMNYGKAGWPLNVFPGICVWIQGDNKWTRYSGSVQCEANTNLYSKTQEYEKFNTLYFQFDFKENQKVFFAYNPPYAYTDLLQLLDSIEQKKLIYFHRKLAGTTLLGNRLQLLTITNFQKIKESQSNLPVIVLLARTHAGETVSSWIMHNIITFLISNHETAQSLRDNFSFKVFPMVNPDGVVHGNYRCSLIGRDLNRRWKNPSKQYYPQIYFIKNQIIDIFEKRTIKMVLDFHGHTQKRKAFFYGCNDKAFPYKTRLFPYLTTKFSSNFQFGSCNFSMQKSKQSTARITLYNLIKSHQIFTIQTSQFGMNDKFLSSESLQDISLTICKAIYKFYKINRVNGASTALTQFSTPNSSLGMTTIITPLPSTTISVDDDSDSYQEEILSNPMLLKIGCDPSDGSDSQPSVCNINFEKINKMAVNLQSRPASQNNNQKKRPPTRPQSYNKTNLRNYPVNNAFSTDKSRQINQKRQPSPTMLLRGSTAISHRRQKDNTKFRTPKLQYTKQISSNSKIKNLNPDIQKKPLRMINFQLLIDDSVRRKSSLREDGFELIDYRMNHPNYHMFQKRCMFRNRSYNWNKNSV